MQLFKRIGAALFVVVIIVAVTAPCFAVGLALDAIDIWSIGLQAYNDSHGIISYYTTNGYFNNNTPEFSQSTYQLLWNNLFDEYRSYDSSQAAIDAWVDTYASSILPFGTPIDGSDVMHLAIELKPAVVEWYDKFENWLLNIKMGVPSDSGHYHTSGTFSNNNISTITGGLPEGAFDNYSHGNSYADSNAIIAKNSSNQLCKLTLNDSTGNPVYNGPIYLFYYPSTSATWDIVAVFDKQYCLRNATVTVRILQAQGSNYWSKDANFSMGSGMFFITSSVARSLTSELYIPYYATLNAGLAAYNVIPTDSYSIALAPKEKVREDGGDIYIPQPSDVNYIPQGINVPTNMEYDPTNTAIDNLTDILDKIIAKTSPWDLADSISPSPVTSPFVPFNFPSFNFNFSGIWYYVVNWVNSLGSGFSLITSAWAALPYAMTLPIYATAVIVLVVGVFKRFFG